MAKFNGVFVARVAHFKKAGHETDMNGNPNVVLEVVAGKAPQLNKRIIAGSIAMSAGMVFDDTIAVSFVEGEPDKDYGRQFKYTKIGRLTTIEALGSIAQFGMPEEVEVEEGRPIDLRGNDEKSDASEKPAEKPVEMAENATS